MTFPSTRSCLCFLMAVATSIAVRATEDRVLDTFDVIKLTDVYYSEGASAGDLNGDKIPDAVYGPHWYEGPDFKKSHEIYPAKPQNMEGYSDHFFHWVYDFNQDGLVDVFVAGFPGTPGFVYENPGKAGWDKPWPKHQVFDSVSNESPVLTQIVGDERPELVCTYDGYFGFATVDWTKPFSKWTFHPVSEKVAAVPFGHGLGVGDVDGDKKLDILSPDGWYQQPSDKPESSRWLFHPQKFTNAYGGSEMYAYDVDGDGDSDIITSLAAHDFGLAWYEQLQENGERLFREHLIMGDSPDKNKYGLVFSELHSVALADVDGDGLKDIITGKTYYSHHKSSPMWDAGAVVYWFRLQRNKDGVDWVPYKAAADTGVGREISVIDINNDKLLDIVVGGMKGGHVLLHRRAKVDETTWKAAQPTVFSGVATATTTGKKLALGSDGRLPGAFEGESLKVTQVTGGTAAPQNMSGFPKGRWSNNDQMWWTGPKIGDRLALEFEVPADDTYSIAAAFTMARDYGIFQVLVNGEPLGGELDFYSAPDVIHTGLIELGEKKLAKGKHTFTLKLTGKNAAAAPGHMAGLDLIAVRNPAGKLVGTSQTKPSDFKLTAAPDAKPTLGFESGTLEGWSAEGSAFAKQPVRGDTVAARRGDMKSNHQGEFWIGTYEIEGDAATGTLTSNPIDVASPWATFLVAGGTGFETRVEVLDVDSKEPILRVNGKTTESMSRAVVDLRKQVGKKIVIRVIDESKGGWGHINFDDFQFHEQQPGEPTPSLVSLVPDEYPLAGVSAEEAAKAMTVPEGFSIQVGASEPEILQPIAMAFDERGRLWVAEAYEYPVRAPEGKGRDRILIFEDKDGDGKLETRKVFAENLNLISGLEVGFGGVWVGAAPYLLFIPDKNGDDKPDSKPEVLLDGWGLQDTHETLNAFIWGPDGWLYGCHGVFTHSKVGKPGTPDKDRIPINAGVWRYHPTRHVFEVFAHGTSNPWGVDFNDRGQSFVTACVIPHLFHMIQGGRYNRQAGNHFNPYTYDDIKTVADHLHYLGANPHGGNSKSDQAGGGHAHCGAMIYLGGAWPETYRDQIFMNNIHGQRLNVDILEAKGSGYVGRHGKDFLLTGDAASQILNFRYGPDGQAWMIDWYDMQACHLTDPGRHDRSNGRIYKISYGKPKAVEVDLAKADDMTLAKHVLNENDWFVRHSRKVLQERSQRQPMAAAAKQFLIETATKHADETRRLRALWVLHATGNLDAYLTNALLNDASPYVRGWMIQCLMEQTEDAPKSLLAKFAQMARVDASPVVRLYLASAAQRLPAAARWEIVQGLVSHKEDIDDHNLPLMYWYAAEPLVEVDLPRALELALSCSETQPLVRDFMMRRIASFDSPTAMPSLVKGLTAAADAKLQTAFLDAIRGALKGQRSAAKPEGWDAAFAKLSASPNESIQYQVAALGAVFGDAKAKASLYKLADLASLDPALRSDAAIALLAIKDEGLSKVIPGWLGDATLRSAALRAVAEIELPEAVEGIIANYAKLNTNERRLAISTLSSRASYGLRMLQAMKEKKLPSADLPADLVRQLQSLKSEEIDSLLGSVWGTVRETAEDKAKMIEEYKALVANADLPQPDVVMGRAIFAKTCQQCHVLYGVGSKIGPDLTGSNRSNLDYLLSNIVDPSSVMAKEYQPTMVLTDSGRAIVGLLRAENDKSITIQTSTEVVDIPLDEIEERKLSDKSMMPDDQLRKFTEHEVRSLFAYLVGKAQNPMLLTPETAALMFNGKDLTGWTGEASLWSVDNGEIVGKSNGLDRNQFLIGDLVAGDFKLTLEVKLVGNAGNSGIQFRSVALPEGEVKGYQADVGEGWWGKLYEEHGRALLWDKSGEAHVKNGEWNTYEIEAVGHKIQTRINGQLCVDLDDPDGETAGVFALQLHSGGPTEVRFRNIKIEAITESK